MRNLILLITITVFSIQSAFSYHPGKNRRIHKDYETSKKYFISSVKKAKTKEALLTVVEDSLKKAQKKAEKKLTLLSDKRVENFWDKAKQEFGHDIEEKIKIPHDFTTREKVYFLFSDIGIKNILTNVSKDIDSSSIEQVKENLISFKATKRSGERKIAFAATYTLIASLMVIFFVHIMISAFKGKKNILQRFVDKLNRKHIRS